jgi:hypothetical protein
MIRNVPGDERAGADSADEIPLVHELLVRAQHGQPRDAKVGGETSGGGNPLPGSEASVQDSVAHSVKNLSE